MDYFDHPAISNTKLGWFDESPAHFKYYLDNKQPDREAYLIGSVAHCSLLEPDKLKLRYHIHDESKRPEPDKNNNSKKNKEWKAEIIAAYPNKKLITLEEHEVVMRMMEVLQKHSFVQELLVGCEFEKEVYWTDPETGIECKKKVDGDGKIHRIDYKTAESAKPKKWQKAAWNNYVYQRQVGFYDLDVPKEFYMIVQEKKPPFAVSVHRCTQPLIDYGKNEAMKILHKIKACQKYDLWPGYEAEIFKPEGTDREQQYFDFDIPMWVIQSM